MKLFYLDLALALLLGIGACAKLATPWSPKDYPCTPQGHMCSDHGCCGNDEACGGDEPGCPPGSCCYIGPDTARRVDAGADGR